MKITLIQMNSSDDRTANLSAAGALIDRAVASEKPDMLVLPEMFAAIGGNRATSLANAETLPEPGDAGGGPVCRFLAGRAREHAVFIHGGSLLERDGAALYNTSVAFDRTGRECARYRKIHLFDVTAPDGRQYRESALFGRGGEIVTYDADGLRVGCSICYDLRFPEMYRTLQRRGAHLIMAPSAFTLATGKDHWELLVRSRALETGCYLVAPDQVGRFPDGKGFRESWGHSMIADPWGQVLVRIGAHPGFASAIIAPDYINEVRARLPVHDHHVLETA